ncbi:hypothetical protein [Terracidiphilus sp.]|jgi:hypothetical protein|uniref:hypothetical protein n=1 Tax=Terracidiphilus sp. TaxID=1964191 RepID=UPI003C240F71
MAKWAQKKTLSSCHSAPTGVLGEDIENLFFYLYLPKEGLIKSVKHTSAAKAALILLHLCHG